MTTLEVPPQPLGVADVIREVNASSETVENQYLRARHAADIAQRSIETADVTGQAARGAQIDYRTHQAEHPQRAASLPWQSILALATVAADGVACFFAAQALNGSPSTTVVWTALFLVVLAGGEIALDVYRDRNWTAWRAVLTILGTFILGLGALRFWYLATVGVGGMVPSTIGAALFTTVTAGFIFLGYRALRAAETPQTWRARRRWQAALRIAGGSTADARRNERERDRLIDAYLVEVRRLIQRTHSLDEQHSTEAAVRNHLLGKAAFR